MTSDVIPRPIETATSVILERRGERLALRPRRDASRKDKDGGQFD